MKNKNFIFGAICVLFLGMSSLYGQNLTVEGTTITNGLQASSFGPTTDNAGMNTTIISATNSRNKFINFRGGGNPFAFSGAIFSTYGDNFFVHGDGKELDFRFSTDNSTAPTLPFSQIMSLSSTGDLSVNGNVGVGTDDPQAKLDVNGNVLFQNDIAFPTTFTANNASNYIERNDFKIISNNNGLYISVPNQANQRRASLQVGHASTGFAGFIGDLLLNPFGGNVGIGLTSPTFKLEVSTNSAAKPLSSTWTISSDRRLKTGVKSFSDGLEVLEKIRPVYFHYNGKAGLPTEEEGIGIIAQEMQEIAPYMIKPYIYKNKDGSEEEYLSYDANALFYILVNSVQEQQDEIEAKDSELQELNERLAKLETLVQQLASGSGKVDISSQTTTLTDATLLQNQPNPFTEATTIRYFIPNTVKRAELRITDINGKMIKAVVIDAKGEGQTTLQAQSLSSGTYLYSLVLDGMVQDTKQMVLTKN